MELKLSLTRSYLSILALPEVTLPPFALITGLNGSGKTHLLKAIADEVVRIEGVAGGSQNVRYFDWHTMAPQNEKVFKSAELAQEREDVLRQLDVAFERSNNQIVAAAREVGLPAELLSRPRMVGRLTLAELQEILPDADQARAVHAKIQMAVDAVSKNMYSQLPNNPSFRQLAKLITDASGLPLALCDRETFADLAPAGWGHVDFFQRSFGRLFVAYRDLWLRNRLQQMAKADGVASARPLSDEEFRTTFSLPPWDFLNATLSDAGLDFEIDSPDLYGLGSYEPKLRKKTSGAEVRFEDLSSGEKVLVSFTNCLYSARDDRQISVFPKVLLLDEVDALLHPSMSRMILKTITDTLVGQFGISVIMTTHSPTTVAIAPSDAIYVMEAGRPGVHKVSKERALSLLTDGVPTLSVDFSGRRQVFVESPTDARVYEGLYQLARQPYLDSERSLTFLSCGTSGPLGDQNTGCDQVRRIVNGLKKSGNKSVLGLIDWDGKNNPSDRVIVLAQGRRDGLENCLFDPLVLACLIAMEVKDRREPIGLPKEGGANELRSFEQDRLQQVADSVQALVLGADYDAASPSRTCEYAGGLSLEVKDSFLRLDDHGLEARVLEVAPALEHSKRRCGSLLVYVAEYLLPEFPEFIPKDVLDAFAVLLTAEL